MPNIDLMSRDFIILGEKLKIKGYKSKYKNPYLNKEKLKSKILEEIQLRKNLRKLNH